MSAGTVIATVGTFFAAVSAGAAVAAVVFAKRTVEEATTAARQFDDAQKEAERHHTEAMMQMAQAREAARQQSMAQLMEMSSAASLDSARHHVEMEARHRIAAEEAESHRLVQLERVSELLLEIVHVARDEYRNPPPPLSPGVTGSRLFAMLRRLDNALAALAALGGEVPGRVMDFAHDAPMRARSRESVLSIVGDGIAALDAIQTTISGINLVEH